MLAALKNYTDVVQLLCDHRADLNMQVNYPFFSLDTLVFSTLHEKKRGMENFINLLFFKTKVDFFFICETTQMLHNLFVVF